VDARDLRVRLPLCAHLQWVGRDILVAVDAPSLPTVPCAERGSGQVGWLVAVAQR
jgi:hypothetical protein